MIKENDSEKILAEYGRAGLEIIKILSTDEKDKRSEK